MRHVHISKLVFLEDTEGKGHVANLSIRVPDGFDVIAWSRSAT
jgi:hypothetical protein